MADTSSRAGKGYWTPEIEEYLRGLFAREEPGMADALEALSAAGMPAIQVSPTDGRIIEVLLRMIGARRVVELGTLAGYSAQWILRALPPDGHLWTVEADPKHAEVARGVFERAGLSQRVTIVEGTGEAALPRLVEHGPFDAVFIDADKPGYPHYARWAAANLRPGGLVLGDNTYLFGKLAGHAGENDDERASIAAMRAFHETLARDFEAVCLPTPDGLSVGVKR